MQSLWDALAPRPPSGALEPGASVAQCNYELLRAFSKYASRRRFRFALASGTLLGAMRNEPPGLLQWEHDVDVYMPARDAAQLAQRLHAECGDARKSRAWRSRWCTTLHLKDALADSTGKPCCGFGFKIFHRRRDACELDVLVLSAARAPFMHGETWLWPAWAPLLSTPYNAALAAFLRLARHLGIVEGDADGGDGVYYVIPEDVPHKALMSDVGSRWCATYGSEDWRWCGGPPVSYFHAEYFAPGDLFPLGKSRSFHGLQLPVPRRPWALLNRTYGSDSAYIARLNEHSDAMADLRLPEYARLRTPARVKQLPWWRS